MQEMILAGVSVGDQWAARHENTENFVKYLRRGGPQAKTCGT